MGSPIGSASGVCTESSWTATAWLVVQRVTIPTQWWMLQTGIFFVRARFKTKDCLGLDFDFYLAIFVLATDRRHCYPLLLLLLLHLCTITDACTNDYWRIDHQENTLLGSCLFHYSTTFFYFLLVNNIFVRLLEFKVRNVLGSEFGYKLLTVSKFINDTMCLIIPLLCIEQN